jgi:osmotically-inducible protein OsmY
LLTSSHLASANPAGRFRKNTMTRFATTTVLLAAFALTTLAGCASTANKESTGQYMDDTAITTKVKSAILNDPALKSAEINVETFKGRVQLSGFVSSRTSIDRAVQVAQGVSGVSSVANDMRVK